MTLGFSTQIKNKPTYFVEKIWEAILQKGIQINANEFIEYGRKSLPKNYIVGTNKPKLHTIRKDEKNRWKVGNKIHFVINNRTKNRFQFAPILQVKEIQLFEIKYQVLKEKTVVSIFIDEILQGEVILVNCKIKSSSFTVDCIALHDGFDSTNDFLEWFSEDFKGKMIHWTDLRY